MLEWIPLQGQDRDIYGLPEKTGEEKEELSMLWTQMVMQSAQRLLVARRLQLQLTLPSNRGGKSHASSRSTDTRRTDSTSVLKVAI